jgi:hypothetical protein
MLNRGIQKTFVFPPIQAIEAMIATREAKTRRFPFSFPLLSPIDSNGAHLTIKHGIEEFGIEGPLQKDLCAIGECRHILAAVEDLILELAGKAAERICRVHLLKIGRKRSRASCRCFERRLRWYNGVWALSRFLPRAYFSDEVFP